MLSILVDAPGPRVFRFCWLPRFLRFSGFESRATGILVFLRRALGASVLRRFGGDSIFPVGNVVPGIAGQPWRFGSSVVALVTRISSASGERNVSETPRNWCSDFSAVQHLVSSNTL